MQYNTSLLLPASQYMTTMPVLALGGSVGGRAPARKGRYVEVGHFKFHRGGFMSFHVICLVTSCDQVLQQVRRVMIANMARPEEVRLSYRI